MVKTFQSPSKRGSRCDIYMSSLSRRRITLGFNPLQSGVAGVTPEDPAHPGRPVGFNPLQSGVAGVTALAGRGGITSANAFQSPSKRGSRCDRRSGQPHVAHSIVSIPFKAG